MHDKIGIISIRKIDTEDASFLYQLMNNDTIIKSLNEVETTLDSWTNAISEWKQDPDEEDYVIQKDRKSIGWFGINNLLSENKQACIKIIALLPEHQGNGIGEFVIHQLIESLRFQGYTSIGLFTDHSNIIAQKCYAKCGFEISNTIIQVMQDGKTIKRYKMTCLL